MPSEGYKKELKHLESFTDISEKEKIEFIDKLYRLGHVMFDMYIREENEKRDK